MSDQKLSESQIGAVVWQQAEILTRILSQFDVSKKTRGLILADFPPQWSQALILTLIQFFPELGVDKILVEHCAQYATFYPNPDGPDQTYVLIDALTAPDPRSVQNQFKAMLYRYPQKRLVVIGGEELGSWNLPNYLEQTQQIRVRDQILKELMKDDANSNFSDQPLLGTLFRDDAALLNHAEKIIPRYELKDLVLPPLATRKFREVLNIAQNKIKDSYDLGWREKHQRGHSVVLVFNGASGTGKTMAAEVVAQSLGYDLYRIDYSSIQSKYIGEAEKSLKAIFEAAQGVRGVLLFDEGDAIFAKRTDGSSTNDRYSNGEVNFLLQELERFEGIIIISTNLERNMDDAFMRRFTKVMKFPFPEPAIRAELWKTMVPSRMKLEGDIDFELLGQYPLSGGEIRNTLIEASLIGRARGDRQVTMVDLLWAVKRGCQKKNIPILRESMPVELGEIVAEEWEDTVYRVKADPYQVKHVWNQAERRLEPAGLTLHYRDARIRMEQRSKAQTIAPGKTARTAS